MVVKREVMVPDFPYLDRRNWGSENDSCARFREQHNLQNTVFCDESLGKNHALYAHLTYKDVDRFRNGSLLGLSRLC